MKLVSDIEQSGWKRVAGSKPSAAAGQEAPPSPAPRRRGRPSKHGLKRQALLEGAATTFNARGIAGTSLADIAEQLGLSRATVYYYVNDRAELVFQCYLRACEVMAEDLAAAGESASGFERLIDFVTRALDPDRPPSAVLSEINYLEPAHASVVRVAHARNVAALVGFIEAGVADGSVRACDAEVAAQSIVGMLAWAHLSPYWVRGPRGKSLRVRFLAVTVDLLTDGVAREPKGAYHSELGMEPFLPGPINAFDRREASEMKVEQLLTAASRLFNRDGIESTSLDAITASLGATKGVLYHYLRDKTDLVARCYERAFDLYERFAATAKAEGRSGLEQAMLGTHLNVQAQACGLSPLMPQPGFEALPEDRRVPLVARATRLNLHFNRLLREGVAEGSCRDCDTRIVAQLPAGTFGWLPKWLPPDDPRTPQRLADEISDLVYRGLKAR
jgi:AcrR family transcriptional regulator